MRRFKFGNGFTLVELLVVIGIIALLISILLPSLSAARRSANAVKCSTQLRDLGNAFKFYAIDNRNYYPPCILNCTVGTAVYNIDGIDYPRFLLGGTRAAGAYWFNFINKYESKTTVGGGVTNLQDNAVAKKTTIWGCPAFDGYNPASGSGSAVDFNPVQTGYGMNPQPYFTPEGGSATPSAVNGSMTAANIATGTGFIKANAWGKLSALRCLLMDSALYQTNVNTPPTDGSLGWFSGDQNVTVDDSTNHGATAASLWRHGRHPSQEQQYTNHQNSGWLPNATGSKVAFNILYCDGHVSSESDAKLAYSTVRMKFPG